MLRYPRLLLFLLLLCFFRCAPKPLSSDDNSTAGSGKSLSTPKLLFLGYQLKQDTITGKITSSLVQKILADGKVEHSPQVKKPVTGDLLVSFLDAKGKVVAQIVQRDPFIKTVESVDASGALSSKQARVNLAEILLRVNFDPRINSVVLSIVDAQRKKLSFFTHTL